MEEAHHLIADVRGWGHLQYLPNGADVQDANGRLIAAAPDLLEALERLMVECDLVSEDAVKAYANARAVIAKATGDEL